MAGEGSTCPGGSSASIGGDAIGSPITIGDHNLVLSGSDGAAVSETLAAVAPPRLHQLPTPPADFTGREQELNGLVGRVTKERVVILGLHGMGGVGKTTLALRLAERLEPEFPDAQLYLDLRGTGPAPLAAAEAQGQVIHAFLPAARLPMSEAELGQLYRSVLHDKRALLVLDDARDGAQVKPLLPPAKCAAIVTSRRHFALTGMLASRLDVLPEHDARKLLVKIAPRIADEAVVIAELCDGLPLALRLAGGAMAARPDLSAADYARRLADEQRRLSLLDASLELSDAPQGIEASFHLSYDLLCPELQLRWLALSVFPDSFAPDGAASVWGLALDATREALSKLVTYSLLEWSHGDHRYRLHALARLFTLARVDGTERAVTQQRHAQHYERVGHTAQRLYLRGGHAVASGLKLFDIEWDNIRVGQAWAEAHAKTDDAGARLCSDYPWVTGYLLALRLPPGERIRWYDVALAAARRLNDRTAEGMHLGSLGHVYLDVGEPHRAIALSQEALGIRRELGDRRSEALDLGNLGLAYSRLGEPVRAIGLYEQALAIAREIDDRRLASAQLGNLGGEHRSLGNLRRAIAMYEQALSIRRAIRDRHGEGVLLGNLGLTCSDLGEPRRGIELIGQALAIARELRDRVREGAWLAKLGDVYVELGEPRRAVEHYNEALWIARSTGDGELEVSVLTGLASSAAGQGDPCQVIELFEQILRIHRELGQRQAQGIALTVLGLAYRDLGEPRRVVEFLEQALPIHREFGDRRAEGEGLGNLGNAYLALGDFGRGMEFLNQAAALFREVGDRLGEGTALGALGQGHATLGDHHGAVRHYEQAGEALSHAGDRRGERRALSGSADAYAALGDFRHAIECNERVLAVDRELGDHPAEGDDLGKLGIAHLQLGEPLRAIGYFEQALQVHREVGDRVGEAADLGNLGNAHRLAADPRRGLELCDEALAVFRELGDRAGEATSLWNMSQAFGALGDYGPAVARGDAALRIFEQLGDRKAAVVHGALGRWRPLADRLRSVTADADLEHGESSRGGGIEETADPA